MGLDIAGIGGVCLDLFSQRSHKPVSYTHLTANVVSVAYVFSICGTFVGFVADS